MHKNRFCYIVRLQYLGFRYSGWQIQPGQRTIEGMLVKTLKFILPNTKLKILASGRTDAKVSALDAVFELFMEENSLPELEPFIELFNTNLPPDIRIISITPKDADFNIIKDSKTKEYMYLFSFGEKNHPFCAPFIANILEHLDIDLMKDGASLFMGAHDFTSYTAQLKPNMNVVRTIDTCKIVENNLLTANFFPSTSYLLQVKGAGFLRYQIRMIMGVLIRLGKGELTLNQIEDSFDPANDIVLNTIAPGSGLVLNQVDFMQK